MSSVIINLKDILNDLRDLRCHLNDLFEQADYLQEFLNDQIERLQDDLNNDHDR